VNVPAVWLRRAVVLATPRLDLPLLLALLALSTLGLMTLHSAAGGNTQMVASQAARLLVGFGAIWIISRIPPLQLRRWTPWLLLASVILLLLVPVFGTGRSGRHWLNLGVVYIQPAELLKLTVPMAVAALLHGRSLPPGWLSLAGCAVIIAVPTVAILLQPDLGTAMLVAASGAFAVFLAGIAWWKIGLMAGGGLAMLPLMWTQLREYQQQRILTFIDPEADPLGSGWNIIQSKIAVGSGGMFGKGWGESTQARLNFLPEQTTDFILAVYAEEFGLVGVIALLLLNLFIIGRCLWIAASARETYSRLLAGALGLTFFVYMLVNGGMISGLLPVVGVPMPLLSFGGTSAVSLLAGFGIVMSIHAHKRFMA
jgi:rod shape determining protein RodA